MSICDEEVNKCAESDPSAAENSRRRSRKIYGPRKSVAKYCGWFGRQFYRSEDPTNSIKLLKEKATKENSDNWIGLSMVLRLRQHNIGYTADGFYRSDDPTNSVKALKEGG